ncbi:MAG: Hpt domain-containing protein [Myxococcales bacterium]|nr:Hpt domain-containing protein [Myxococcales bacterium]
MSDDRSTLDPELIDLFRVEVERRASTIINAAGDPRSAQRTLHALRGAAAMMGASGLAARLAALESTLREDPEGVAPLLGESLATAITAAGLDASALTVTDLRSSRPAILPTPATGIPSLEPGAPTASYDQTEEGSPSSRPPGQRADRTSAERISLERISSDRISSDRISSDRVSLDPHTGAPRPRSSVEPDVRAFFVSEAYSRLELFSSAVAKARDASVATARNDALRDAFRHAHSIKGSASTVGFHGIAVAAHAIESALAGLLAAPNDTMSHAVTPLTEAATMLAAALAVPDQAENCAQDVQKVLKDAGFSIETAALRPVNRAVSPSARMVDEVRVPSTALHALGERLTDISSVGERVSGASARSIEFGRALSDLSGSLDEAIRRLGPPRPWGVAAEVLERFHSVSRFLRDAATALESEGVAISREADALSSMTTEARDDLQQLSAATVRWLFDRVVTVANAAARSNGKELRVVREGEQVELPKAVAERLVEPLGQLVRNAVVHGIEVPTRRLARGKSVRGTLRLVAERRGDSLTFEVEDDGAGVDIDAVRTRGRASGLLGENPTESDTLALLFVPGFSTRSHADTAAGRGVGLDLVRREAIDLGGDVIVSSRAGHGTRFKLTVPIRVGTRGVLVVSSGPIRVALPIDRVRRVRMADASESVPCLSSWLGIAEPTHDCRNVVDVEDNDRALSLGVDWIEHAKDVVVRPLPALCAGVSAWIGAIIEPEGGVLLVVDPFRVDR